VSAPIAFVAGWPVAHSRSPLIHRHWLARYGLAGDYRAEAVPPGGFAAFLSSLAAKRYVGGNVTIPHKEAAFRACAEATPVARRLGAVNTLWLEQGKLLGDNTDVFGFAANLDAAAPDWRQGETALVLGAGGSSRAIVAALLDAGLGRVIVLNRTAGRAEELARLLGDRVRGGGLNEVGTAVAAADLVVNTTPSGLGDIEELRVDWRDARADAIAADIVYVPLMTAFLRGAAERGLHTVDGLGMLLHQAAPGFERWFGRRPEVDAELRRVVIADLEMVKPCS
jgi:shikimate dehydrogenase